MYLFPNRRFLKVQKAQTLTFCAIQWYLRENNSHQMDPFPYTAPKRAHFHSQKTLTLDKWEPMLPFGGEIFQSQDNLLSICEIWIWGQGQSWTSHNIDTCMHVKGAYSLHTPFLELIRMIKYRVSIGEWNIYYCNVVPMGCPKHIFIIMAFWWFASNLRFASLALWK